MGERCPRSLDRNTRRCPMTDATRAREIFESTFGDSTNFMTPDAISYQVAGGYMVELSRGAALLDPTSPLFGVTVLMPDGSRTTLGACFNDRADALEYIGNLS